MPPEKKAKKEAPPEVRIQDAFDAKASASTPEFVVWAMRHGEEQPAAQLVLMRKGDSAEKGIVIKRGEFTALRALLEYFEMTVLPKLDGYGIKQEED